MQHLKITINGKVQGVGFRFSAQQAARRCGITGTVRNSGFNKVYIEAEGTPENLEQFLEFCNRGPFGARVENVQVEEGPVIHFSDFLILSSDRGF